LGKPYSDTSIYRPRRIFALGPIALIAPCLKVCHDSLGEEHAHEVSKSARASSKVAAVPPVHSPGRDHRGDALHLHHRMTQEGNVDRMPEPG
jgi:hypothetical protein